VDANIAQKNKKIQSFFHFSLIFRKCVTQRQSGYVYLVKAKHSGVDEGDWLIAKV
jgi:hypothetical protein